MSLLWTHGTRNSILLFNRKVLSTKLTEHDLFFNLRYKVSWCFLRWFHHQKVKHYFCNISYFSSSFSCISVQEKPRQEKSLFFKVFAFLYLLLVELQVGRPSYFLMMPLLWTLCILFFPNFPNFLPPGQKANLHLTNGKESLMLLWLNNDFRFSFSYFSLLSLNKFCHSH